MAANPMPPYALVSRELMYDPDSGNCFWLRSGRGRKVNRPAGTFNSRSGRWSIHFKGKTYARSRLAYYLQTGTDPGELEVDHINHDPSDDRWCNLRAITRSANAFARRAHNPSTGIKGVYARKCKDGSLRYDTMVCWKRKTKYLGCYTDIHEAARVVAEFYRDNGVINFQTPNVKAALKMPGDDLPDDPNDLKPGDHWLNDTVEAAGAA